MKAEQYPYRSGWCGTGKCGECDGEYAGTKCMCPCGHGKPVQELIVFVPDRLPSPARLLDPVPLLQAVWLGTEVLAVNNENRGVA